MNSIKHKKALCKTLAVLVVSISVVVSTSSAYAGCLAGALCYLPRILTRLLKGIGGIDCSLIGISKMTCLQSTNFGISINLNGGPFCLLKKPEFWVYSSRSWFTLRSAA
jgi:hypothetical protein